MIFKLNYADRTEYYQAKNQLKLIQGILTEQGEEDVLNIETIVDISDDEAKTIMLRIDELDDTVDRGSKISLFDMVVGEDVCMLATSENC